MIRTNNHHPYTLEQMRNAEELLTDIDLVYHSAQKLKREYTATIAIAGPEGYPDHSSERSGVCKKCSLDAPRTLERMDTLTRRYRLLLNMLSALKKDLALIRGTREFRLLLYRFKKGLNAAQTTAEMNCSMRNYYRIRKQALCIVCASLEKTPLGREVLLHGSSAAIHKYFK